MVRAHSALTLVSLMFLQALRPSDLAAGGVNVNYKTIAEERTGSR